MFLNCPVCAVRDLKCDVVLDMATLTGAQVAKCHTINISNSIINREYRMAAIMPVHYLTLRAGRQLWLVLKPVTDILIPSLMYRMFFNCPPRWTDCVIWILNPSLMQVRAGSLSGDLCFPSVYCPGFYSCYPFLTVIPVSLRVPLSWVHQCGGWHEEQCCRQKQWTAEVTCKYNP